MLRNTDHSWGAPAKLLHWAVALLVLVQCALGWMAVSWRMSPAKLDLFVWHKSIGVMILLLMMARLVWRALNVSPLLPAHMSAVERFAAHFSHALLYVLLLLMPVTGWVINSAANIPFKIFWLMPLPALVLPDSALAEAAKRVHFGVFVVLVLVVLVHVGAALRHHFINRDTVLTRMLPKGGGAR